MDTKEEMFEALLEALRASEVLAAKESPSDSSLGGISLKDFEAHARGLQPLSEEQLSEIRSHPVRHKLLAAFEREYAREEGLEAKLHAWIRSLVGDAGLLRPTPVPVMKVRGADSAPTYPLIIERAGVFLEEFSIQMIFAPAVTEAGELVFKVAFNATIAEIVVLPSIRAKLSVFAASQERLLLGRVEVTDARPYIKLPLPSSLRELPCWREIRPGAPLPFVLVLHLNDVHLEASTLHLNDVQMEVSTP